MTQPPWEPPVAGTEAEHLALVEDHVFGTKLSGVPTDSFDIEDEFESAASDRPEELYARWDDAIEEYGRRTGHADLLREAVDGRTGEDPPPGWRPRS